MHRTTSAAALAAIALTASHASAGIVASYDAGAGSNHAGFQIDFSNGNAYLVDVRWSGTQNGYNGFDATQTIAAAIPGAQLQFDAYDFGAFVTGIGIGQDYEYGTGDLWPKVENYWHYWVKVGGAWEQAAFGPSDHVLTDGTDVAWVFGSGAAPQSVPAPGAVVTLLALVRGRRRRR
jgi:hypothetical protein